MNKPATGEVITCEQLRDDLDCLGKKLARVFLHYLPTYKEHYSFAVDGFDIFSVGEGVGCMVYSSSKNHATWMDLHNTLVGFVVREQGLKNNTPYIVRDIHISMIFNVNTNSYELVNAASETDDLPWDFTNLRAMSQQDFELIEEGVCRLDDILSLYDPVSLQDPN